MPDYTYNIGLLDHGDENTRTRLTIFGADIAAATTAATTVRTDLEALVTGNVSASYLSEITHVGATVGVGPNNGWSQRESKWLLRYEDNVTGEIFTSEVGTADFSLLPAGSDKLDLTSGAGATFKSSFDANCRSKNGNSVTLLSMLAVGRNL